MDTVKLNNLSEKLLSYMDFIEGRYQEARKSQEKGDFYTEVKPFADEVKAINDAWKEEAASWVRVERPKHIHFKQIESAYDQIEMLSVQAFYPETSRTRFINYLQSVKYILKVMVDELKLNL
ncbi:YppE family protein [Cytobacillus sp. FJAT-54145]|uniref:YppE family protein n=1 Tax=Cytobacillus spartinae TaxID=3299023 RepID=A0ABW6KD79_9BACI